MIDETRIPPALSNALAKLSNPAPRAAFTMRKTAKYQDMPKLFRSTTRTSPGPALDDTDDERNKPVRSFTSISGLLSIFDIWAGKENKTKLFFDLVHKLQHHFASLFFTFFKTPIFFFATFEVDWVFLS